MTSIASWEDGEKRICGGTTWSGDCTQMAKRWCDAASVRVFHGVLGPKPMNSCRPEKKDTKEYGQLLKIILKLEEGEVPARNAIGWEGQKRRATRKECKRLREECEVGGFMAQSVVEHRQQQMFEDDGLSS